MVNINDLLNEISETNITRRIAIAHDEARISYQLRSNTVMSFKEFSDIIGDYYNYHFIRCISNGGSLSNHEATSRAKELLEQQYRRRNGDIVTAYNDAHDGTNSGLRGILDMIAEGLKAEAVSRYIRDIFDRMIAPNSWTDKVEIIRQFIEHVNIPLSLQIQNDQPERYAHNYTELIQTYVDGLRDTSGAFRRL